MRYFRCRCGKHEAWSSMGVSPCDGCEDCNTTLAESAGGHETPIPHDEVVETTTSTYAGEAVTKTRRFCQRCMAKLPEPPETATPA